MATTKPKFYWHIHHKILLEETSNIQERIDYIKAEKAEAEIPLRLKLMTSVLHPEKLPARFRKASEAYHKAREAYNKTEEAYYKASEAYIKAREAYDKADEASAKAWKAYLKAREACNKALKAYIKASEDCIKAREAYDKVREASAAEIEKLHREEHPDCSWNGETIFSKVD